MEALCHRAAYEVDPEKLLLTTALGNLMRDRES